MKKKMLESDVPRPPCGCGKPGSCQVEIVVRRLVLERDAGVHSTPFWTPSYNGIVAQVSALVCDDCYRRNVNVTLAVSASIEKASPA